MRKSIFAMAASQHTLLGRGGRLRKRGGQVVSFAPNMIDLCGGASRVAMGGMLVLAGALVTAPEAQAGTFTLEDGVYVLSGVDDIDNDTGLRVNETGDVNITTSADSGIFVLNGAAVQAKGRNVRFTDTNDSFVGGTDGALNLTASGSVTVESNGELNSNHGSAVEVTLATGATASISSTGRIASGGWANAIRVNSNMTLIPGYYYSQQTYDAIGAVEITANDVLTNTDAIVIAAKTNGPIDITLSGHLQANDGRGIVVEGSGYDDLLQGRGRVNGDVTIDLQTAQSRDDTIQVELETGSIDIQAASLTSLNNGAIRAATEFGNIAIDVGVVTAGGSAIHAFTEDGDVTITVDEITAGGTAVYTTVKDSTGSFSIGSIKATYGHGFEIEAYDADLTIDLGSVESGDDGIRFDLTNAVASITVDSIDVDDEGIAGHVYDSNVIINAGSISAYDDGIDLSVGSSDVNISVDQISAYDRGITIESYGSNIAINAALVQAGDIGIQIEGYGHNDVSITTQAILGAEAGIAVDVDGGDVTISSGNINARQMGIFARSGDGDVSITSTGRIGNFELRQKIGDNGRPLFDGNGFPVMEAVSRPINGSGIFAEVSGGGSINIAANKIEADYNGINAYNGGTGNTVITAKDIVSGYDGISVHQNNYNSVSIEAHNIDAGKNAIRVIASDADRVDIRTTGTVTGEYAAVYADTYSADIRLTNSGTLSGREGGRATVLDLSGDSITIENTGTISGRIYASGGNVNFLNNGRWNIESGYTRLNTLNSTLINGEKGVISAAADAEWGEYSSISGALNFYNRGVISLADGGTGDALYVELDLSFANGSTLAMDVSADGSSDQLIVDGTLTIDAGAKLQLNFLDGQPIVGQRFELVRAGEVIGKFDDNYYSSVLGLRSVEIDGVIFADYVQLRSLNTVALSSNQTSIADALESIPTNSGITRMATAFGANQLVNEVMQLTSDEAVRSAFDQLSGDVHASVRTAMAEDSRLTRNAVLDRLSQTDGRAVWGQILWNNGASDGNRNAGRTKRETWGVMAGADAPVSDNLLLGLAASYQRKDVDQGKRSSDAKVETVSLLGYAGAEAGALRLKAGVGYAWGDVESTRNIRIGDYSDKLAADYSAKLFQSFAEAGVRLSLGEGFVEPMAQIAYVSATTKAFSEAGGSAALTAQAETEKSTISTLGARFSTAAIGAVNFTGMVGWQHSFGSLDPQTTFRFDNSDRFTVAGAAQSRNAGVANVAAQVKLSETATMNIGYDGVLGNAGHDHAAKIGFRFAF